MKHITDVIKYEGGEIKTGLLYIAGSDPIIVEGKIDFRAFGSVRMNGVKVTNTEFHARLAKPTEFKIDKDSAILFNQVPSMPRKIEGYIPVPDVPDMMDSQIAQMHMLFEAWAKERGFLPAEGEAEPSNDLEDMDFGEDDEFMEDFDIPIDNNIADLEEYNNERLRERTSKVEERDNEAREESQGEQTAEDIGEEGGNNDEERVAEQA